MCCVIIVVMILKELVLVRVCQVFERVSILLCCCTIYFPKLVNKRSKIYTYYIIIEVEQANETIMSVLYNPRAAKLSEIL